MRGLPSLYFKKPNLLEDELKILELFDYVISYKIRHILNYIISHELTQDIVDGIVGLLIRSDFLYLLILFLKTYTPSEKFFKNEFDNIKTNYSERNTHLYEIKSLREGFKKYRYYISIFVRFDNLDHLDLIVHGGNISRATHLLYLSPGDDFIIDENLKIVTLIYDKGSGDRTMHVRNMTENGSN